MEGSLFQCTAARTYSTDSAPHFLDSERYCGGGAEGAVSQSLCLQCTQLVAKLLQLFNSSTLLCYDLVAQQLPGDGLTDSHNNTIVNCTQNDSPELQSQTAKQINTIYSTRCKGERGHGLRHYISGRELSLHLTRPGPPWPDEASLMTTGPASISCV